MKWVTDTTDQVCMSCRLSGDFDALIESGHADGWIAVISQEGLDRVHLGYHASEAAAKSAVAAWIGKTMAQFSNALAAGEPRIDEE